MPSASTIKVTTQEKELKAHQSIDLLDPFKQVNTLVEHKIRNMEKRKVKLDSYKLEQEQGKDLNADQLAAVSKYSELMQMLEFARDLSKQIIQIQQDAARQFKKQQKKDQTDRAAADSERAREIMILTNWLHRYGSLPSVREDFVNGRRGAFVLAKEDMEALDVLTSAISAVGFQANLTEEDLGTTTEHFANILDGKSKKIPNTSITYAHIKEILINMNNCGYMYEPVTSETKDIETQSSIDSKEKIQAPVKENLKASIITQGELVEDGHGVSPDMDPAVVATSTTAPPHLLTQQLATLQQVIPRTAHPGEVKSEMVEQEVKVNHDPASSTKIDEFNNAQAKDTITNGQLLAGGDTSYRPPTTTMHMQTVPSMRYNSRQPDYDWQESNYGTYGANPGSGDNVESNEFNNDFMDNNFTTWEGPRDNTGSRMFRGRGGVGNNTGNRGRGSFNNSVNGFNVRGGGNRFNSPANNNRWNSSASKDVRFGDFRPKHERDMGNNFSRGQERGGPSGNSFAGGAMRNGVPRGNPAGGRRPYRGGGGYSVPEY